MLSWTFYKLRVIPSLIPKKYLILSACHIHLAGEPRKKRKNVFYEKSQIEDLPGSRNYLTRKRHHKRLLIQDVCERCSKLCQRSSSSMCLVSSNKKSLETLDEYEELNSEWDQPRIVIIGAGLAGLAAAQRLSLAGLNNYLILEASDRPGGRVMTAWLGDVVVEVGADWIYGGTHANPAFMLASMEQLVPAVYDDCVPDPRNLPIYMTSGAKIIEDFAAEDVLLQEIIRGAAQDLESDFSMAQYISLKISQQLKHFPKARRANSEKVLYALMATLEMKYGASLEELSLLTLDPMRNQPGRDIRIPQGMAGILSPLMKCISCVEAIKYNSQVTKIIWGQEEGARAIVQVGGCDEYYADYVIVTVPLGVLKGTPDLFCPQLPDNKKRAIKQIAFGNTEHIYAEYAQCWWASPQPMILARSPLERLMKEDWTSGISMIEPKAGSTHIVATTINGSDAALLDEVVEESIAIDLTKTIRKFTGDPTIPYPINLLRSKWSTNNFFLGSRSYLSMETKPGHIKTLSEPIPESYIHVLSGDPKNAPILFFAGEATSVDFNGTLQGAIMTGTKQAQKIIDLTKQFKGLPIAESKKREVQKQLSSN